MSGTDVLIIGVTESATIEGGALGDREFDAGAYAHVGSAFGPGGFARENATGTSTTCSAIPRRASRPP